jgi:hypothetical protein
MKDGRIFPASRRDRAIFPQLFVVRRQGTLGTCHSSLPELRKKAPVAGHSSMAIHAKGRLAAAPLDTMPLLPGITGEFS